MDSEYGDPPRAIYRVRTWQTGAALYMGGNVLQFLSYAFAAQSLLLALCIAGAAIIILSNLLLVIFSSKSSVLLTAEELVKLYR